MAERVREAAPGWARNNGDLLFNLGQRFEDFRPLLRTKLGVQTEVEQAELQLTQDKHRRLVVFAASILSSSSFGSGSPVS